MKNTIIRLAEIAQGFDRKKYRTLVYNDESLMLSTKMHGTMDEMAKSVEKSALLESIKTIPINSIKKINYNEKNSVIKVDYEDKNKIKLLNLYLKQKEKKQGIAEEIAAIKNLTKSTKVESRIRLLIGKFVAMIGIGLVFWYLSSIINGQEYTGSRRYAFYAKLMNYLGPNGIMLVGATIIIYLLYTAIKRYKQPAQEITFS